MAYFCASFPAYPNLVAIFCMFSDNFAAIIELVPNAFCKSLFLNSKYNDAFAAAAIRDHDEVAV